MDPPHDHHVCLVSEQAVPNITPALDPAIRPQRVTLVISPGMETRARWLSRVLKEGAGVQVRQWQVSDAWDIEHLLERFLELLEQENNPPILNATGGTKPMSIAAYEAFRAYDYPVFYVHPHSDDLFWIHPPHLPRHQLADHIKLPHFLTAYGAEMESKGDMQVPPVYRQLTTHLVQHIGDYAKAVSALNWYAATADSITLNSKPLSLQHLKWPELQALLEEFQKAGLVRLQGETIVFSDTESRVFVNGGWLELHVFDQVQTLRKRLPVIQDAARGVQVVRHIGKGEVRNELDVAFLANNRFYLVECKTRQLPNQSGQGPGTEAIYKLDTLKDLLGGLHGQGMLVSYQPFSPADRRRAADLGIRICQGRQLQDLPHLIHRWITGQR